MIPAWCADYIGLPFLERGRDRAGIDCWGLARLVEKEQAGVDMPSYVDDYEGLGKEHAAGIERLIRSNLQRFTLLAPGAEKILDLIHLRMGVHAYHLGVIVGDGCMLHIERGCNSVIESYRSPAWRHRIVGFGRPLANLS